MMMRVKMKQMIWKKFIMRIQIRNVGACILWAREVARESNKKREGQVRVRCLEKPFGVNMPQNMERQHEAVFYHNVYKVNVKPWQSGRGTGRKFLWQYWLDPNTIKNCQLAVHLAPLVILVMHPKMHAMHVFKRPQTSKLISSCLMIAIQYYTLWNLITLQIKIHYCVSCEKKWVHKRTFILGCTLRLSVEISDQ